MLGFEENPVIYIPPTHMGGQSKSSEALFQFQCQHSVYCALPL